MGKIDSRTHEYLSEKGRFANLVNYYVYDGERVVIPENLDHLDPTEIAFPYKNGKSSVEIHKFRDILKTACAMYDNKRVYLIIGVENQSEVHYAMPVRTMLYDAERYSKQVGDIAKEHKKDNNPDKIVSSGEYLGGFYKDDRIYPVITIVMFWSPEKWDGPLSLHEMLDVDDEQVLRYVPNYKINLISPYNMDEDDFSKLDDMFAASLKFIKYSDNEFALQELLDSDKIYTEFERESAELINDITDYDMKFEEGKELVNVCKAAEDMRRHAIEANSREIAKALLNEKVIGIDIIARTTNIPLDEVKALAASMAR